MWYNTREGLGFPLKNYLEKPLEQKNKNFFIENVLKIILKIYLPLEPKLY